MCLVLDLIPADKGRENITKNPEDRGKFKVPTLRNIDFTYPYMHDGRFSTLSEVLDHYISGIKNSSTTDKQLIGGINITPLQKKYLISFLRIDTYLIWPDLSLDRRKCRRNTLVQLDLVLRRKKFF